MPRKEGALTGRLFLCLHETSFMWHEELTSGRD